MKLVGLLAVSLAVQGAAPERQTQSAFDRMTLGQVMRLSTLPPARVAEMHCSALASWLDKNEPRHAFALPSGEAARVASAVSAALANDLEIAPELATQLVAELDIEPGQAIGAVPVTEREEKIGELAAPCTRLFSEARKGLPLILHPLAKPSLVDPALATCHALYKVAASRAEGKEAEMLAKDAAMAADLALKGKAGADRDAAEAALEMEAEAALKAPTRDAETEMMRLVVCQPHLRGLRLPEADRSWSKQ